MARRIVLRSDGMFISKPGHDAWFAGPEDLLFSSSRRHLMMVDSGQFFVAPNVRINFAANITQVPLVIGGTLNFKSVLHPVEFLVDLTGFWSSPRAVPAGGTPANGLLCQWVAFMRQQG